MSLKPQTGRVKKVETLPADGTGSPPLLAPRWPLVPVLPTPVVDGQRWCVGASYDVAVEYLGIGGVWVAQPSKQYGVWVWNGQQKRNYNKVEFPIGFNFNDGADAKLVSVVRIPNSSLTASRIKIRVGNSGGTPKHFDLYASLTDSENSGVPTVGTSITGNVNTGFKKLSIQGDTEYVIPAFTAVWTDWFDVDLIPAQDGNSPMLLVSTSGDVTNMTINFTPTTYDNEWDGVSGYYTTGVLGSSCTPYGGSVIMGWDIEAETYDGVYIECAYGDSITAGDSASNGGAKWFGDQKKEKTIERNLAVAGTNLSAFVTALKATSEKPSLALFSVFSPNYSGGTTLLDSDVVEMKSQIREAFDYCNLNKIILVMTELCPNDNYDASADLKRLEVLSYAESLIKNKVSLISSIATMATPNRFQATFKANNVHPNALGVAEMKTDWLTKIDGTYSLKTWIPA